MRHAERLFGDPDYLIRIATTDIAAYQTLRDEKLATLPGVQRLTSTIVMKRIVNDRPFPIPRDPMKLAAERRTIADADGEAQQRSAVVAPTEDDNLGAARGIVNERPTSRGLLRHSWRPSKRLCSRSAFRCRAIG